jgi:hypothetical protein
MSGEYSAEPVASRIMSPIIGKEFPHIAMSPCSEFIADLEINTKLAGQPCGATTNSSPNVSGRQNINSTSERGRSSVIIIDEEFSKPKS